MNRVTPSLGTPPLTSRLLPVLLAIVIPLLLVGCRDGRKPVTASRPPDESGPTATPTVDFDAPAAVTSAAGVVDLFTLGPTTTRAVYRSSLDHRVRSGYGWSPNVPVGGGGGAAGGPAVASSGAGVLQVFTRGRTGLLSEKISTTAGRSWSGWVSLGGALTGRPAASSPEAGRIDVFAPQADGSVWSRSADTSGRRYGWVSLGGALAPGSGPAAVSTGDATTIVVRRRDNTLWSRTRNHSTGGWSPWASLGAQTTLSDPAVASSAPGRVDVYVRGRDDALWYRAAGSTVTSWERLGGVLASGPSATAPPAGGPVTIITLGDGSIYRTGRHIPAAAKDTWSGLQPVPPITRPSWNPHVRCWATLTSITAVLGRARNPSGGATFDGGGFTPGIPAKNTATPPCRSHGVWEYVEIHSVRVRLEFSRGLDGDGDRVGWLADPTQPLGPTTQIHGEISQGFIAAGSAPTAPPNDALVDIQGFVYWDPEHVSKDWHQFTGWEVHPLTAWRWAR